MAFSSAATAPFSWHNRRCIRQSHGHVIETPSPASLIFWSSCSSVPILFISSSLSTPAIRVTIIESVQRGDHKKSGRSSVGGTARLPLSPQVDVAEEIRSTLKPVYPNCPVLCRSAPGRVHQARSGCIPTRPMPSPAHHSTSGTHSLDRFRSFVEVVPLPHHELHSRPCNYSVNAPFVGTPYAVVPANTRVTAI